MSKKKQEKKTQRRRITFKLEVGDFNSWDLKKHTMKKDDKGRWAKIVTLAPGGYEYKFLVDGEWQNDPNNDQVVHNPFGTLNNHLTVEISK
jgi:1,4-alpha-glucan branching enzyme